MTSGSSIGLGGGEVAGTGIASGSDANVANYPASRVFNNIKINVCAGIDGANSIACQVANLRVYYRGPDRAQTLPGVTRKLIEYNLG